MKAARVVSLQCCVCGSGTTGRQWWNRDTGYGVCPACIAWLRERGATDADLRQSYGEEGVHFNIGGAV